MTIVIENKPVDEPSIIDEAIALLPELKVGQSFVVPFSASGAIAARAKRMGMPVKCRREGSNARIGRAICP